MIKIYCDKDGVLSNFIKASFIAHGLDPKTVKKWNYFEDWNIPTKEFWKKIHEDDNFWRNLEPYPWAVSLIYLIKDYDPKYKILTAPSPHHSSWSGKYDWIEQYLGIGDVSRIVMTSSKADLAKENRVLIDDNENNILDWNNEGGFGILFPMPYNKNKIYCINRIEFIKMELERVMAKAYHLSDERI